MTRSVDLHEGRETPLPSKIGKGILCFGLTTTAVSAVSFTVFISLLVIPQLPHTSVTILVIECIEQLPKAVVMAGIPASVFALVTSTALNGVGAALIIIFHRRQKDTKNDGNLNVEFSKKEGELTGTVDGEDFSADAPNDVHKKKKKKKAKEEEIHFPTPPGTVSSDPSQDKRVSEPLVINLTLEQLVFPDVPPDPLIEAGVLEAPLEDGNERVAPPKSSQRPTVVGVFDAREEPQTVELTEFYVVSPGGGARKKLPPVGNRALPPTPAPRIAIASPSEETRTSEKKPTFNGTQPIKRKRKVVPLSQSASFSTPDASGENSMFSSLPAEGVLVGGGFNPSVHGVTKKGGSQTLRSPLANRPPQAKLDSVIPLPPEGDPMAAIRPPSGSGVPPLPNDAPPPLNDLTPPRLPSSSPSTEGPSNKVAPPPQQQNTSPVQDDDFKRFILGRGKNLMSSMAASWLDEEDEEEEKSERSKVKEETSAKEEKPAEVRTSTSQSTPRRPIKLKTTGSSLTDVVLTPTIKRGKQTFDGFDGVRTLVDGVKDQSDEEEEGDLGITLPEELKGASLDASFIEF